MLGLRLQLFLQAFIILSKVIVIFHMNHGVTLQLYLLFIAF